MARVAVDVGGTLSIDVTGGASNITSTTDAGAEDFTIEAAGATDSTLSLKSSGKLYEHFCALYKGFTILKRFLISKLIISRSSLADKLDVFVLPIQAFRTGSVPN